LKTLFSREILYCVLAEIVVLLIHRLIWGFFHLGPEFELTSIEAIGRGLRPPVRQMSRQERGNVGTLTDLPKGSETKEDGFGVSVTRHLEFLGYASPAPTDCVPP
jgi:hypothetical protein